jgi:hypothetical protein
MKTWGAAPPQRGRFDLVTSFMALHWVSEENLPATLRGIRSAMASANADAVVPDSWFVASFHGNDSMESLIKAVNATIDATTLTAADQERPGRIIKSWGDAGAAVAASRWRGKFPNGRADWTPITMLPVARWRALLRDAGFDVNRGNISSRCGAC